MSGLYDAKLSADEMLLLDGRCRPEVQTVVESARRAISLRSMGLPDGLAKMASAIVDVALTDGRLIYSPTRIRYCPCCGRSDGYWPVARSTRYKTKGRPDYDKPKTFPARELQRRFVVIQHSIYAGFCDRCEPQMLPVLRTLLAEVKAEIPEALSGRPSAWIWQRNRHCKQCGWTGHEGEMKRSRALMGDGTFPSGCPSCGAGGMFSSVVEIADGHTLVAADARTCLEHMEG